ncbi:MAG: hypothetical protein QOJ40_2712 [Verrucomicrobiota bacterium]
MQKRESLICDQFLQHGVPLRQRSLFQVLAFQCQQIKCIKNKLIPRREHPAMLKNLEGGSTRFVNRNNFTIQDGTRHLELGHGVGHLLESFCEVTSSARKEPDFCAVLVCLDTIPVELYLILPFGTDRQLGNALRQHWRREGG